MIGLGARLLLTARRKAGLSQRELAKRSGVPQPTIAAIEAGRQDPRVETLRKVLRSCGHELEVAPVLGEGVDRTLIHSLLRYTPRDRVSLLTKEAEFLAVLDRARRKYLARRRRAAS